jgi:XTP/dITP diphosphohydrolase
MGQPALTLAAKLQKRAEQAGLDVPRPAEHPDEESLVASLWALVARARMLDVDLEAALRARARHYRDSAATT